jgi:hypothetical protein
LHASDLDAVIRPPSPDVCDVFIFSVGRVRKVLARRYINGINAELAQKLCDGKILWNVPGNV